MIARNELHWITEAGMFFEKTGPVWETLRELKQRLHDANIDYVVIGGLALNAYQYPRQTIDVDVVITAQDFGRFMDEFSGTIYRRDPKLPRRFVDSQTEVAIDFLIAGQLAGFTSKNPSVRFPDPKDGILQGDLRTVSLAKLIELKLVTWRFKDWGDVVELIRRNKLTETFADQLDPIVRTPYRECFDQATDPHYDSPAGD
jgi:hypothetical protein